MGRKARLRRDRIQEAGATAPARREPPDAALLVLSGVGVLLTAYLVHAEYAGAALKGCSIGSSCDVVLSSRWATLLGLPTSVWGLAAYAALAGAALIGRADRRWQIAWPFAFFALIFSAYLTTISLAVIGAACPYCLTSLALVTAIFVLATWRLVSGHGMAAVRRRFAIMAPLAGAIVLVLHLNYTGHLGQPLEFEDPLARNLAVHLSESGARMYGASWCPHCQDQKALFGRSASRLPYIECSTGRQGSPQTAVCRELGIKIYPTWIINGTRTEEVMSLQKLATASGFEPAVSR
jgi:uncharacterized membrane protein